MPTRKIADLLPKPCQDPDHAPSSHQVFEPGIYEHTCPACGAKTVFRTDKPFLRCGQANYFGTRTCNRPKGHSGQHYGRLIVNKT